jgi:UDP-N-acetylmuramate dehydrogenase
MQVKHNVSLKDYTTLHIGGRAAFLISVTTLDDLKEALIFAREKNIPITVIGGGSNILMSDAGTSGLVIKMEMRGVKYRAIGGDKVEVEAGAGESWDDLVSFAITNNLYGIENLSGIPGTVGAAPIQNIGAYGVELNGVAAWVDVLNTKTLTTKRLTPEACKFSYRDSIFKHTIGKKYIVTGVCFTLTRDGTPNLSYHDLKKYFGEDATPTLDEVRTAILSIRAQKFPDLREVGTAGSFFKNPIIPLSQYRTLLEQFPQLPAYYIDRAHVKIPLGGILESLGWKGKRRGSVRTYEKQALVLVTEYGATAKDVDLFAQEIEKDVKEKIGITLEREVVCLL